MEAFLAHCSTAFSQPGGSLFALFFLGGLMGSLTHCLVMCGPVVACQSACGGCSKGLSAASQWSYHLGRLFTYGALGFLAALLSKQIMATAYWPMLSAAMMVVAGGLFLRSAVAPRQHAPHGLTPRNGFLRGVLMSFIPCGLIYAALMMAATLANPFTAMFAMWLFVLGTIPALLVASGGAAMLAMKWQEWVRGIGRVGMTLNGLTLWVLAARSIG